MFHEFSLTQRIITVCEKWWAQHRGYFGSQLDLSLETIPRSNAIHEKLEFLNRLDRSALFGDLPKDLGVVLQRTHDAMNASDPLERHRAFQKARAAFQSSASIQESLEARTNGCIYVKNPAWDDRVRAGLCSAASSFSWMLIWAVSTTDGDGSNMEFPEHLYDALYEIAAAQRSSVI